MSVWMIGIVVFIGVAAIVGGLSLLLRNKPISKIEERLDILAGAKAPSGRDNKEATILSQPLDDRPGIIDRFLEKFGNMQLFFEQADTNLTVGKLAAICGGLALLGFTMGLITHIHVALLPLVALLLGMMPIFWLFMRRKRRLKQFAAQLPDALEMIARGLRAGQSLAFGFNMVANEMPLPISKEFGRVFEEQNLGVPLDETLRGMTDRIPNLDLKFFVTAVILQRQTGGDLAEILDKIGELIRDRFRIWGQVQALTGEGRLSGVILMALPVALFVAVYQLNPGYVMVLFKDPLGKQMLVIAVIMQIIGALVIKKIVNIKV